MKKLSTIFNLTFLIFNSFCFAQQIEKHNAVFKNNLPGNSASYKRNNYNAVNSLTCDTITTITTKDTLALYSIVSTSAATNGGYVTGNNSYGDSAIATFIPKTKLSSGGQITGVMAVFYRYNNLGTKGTQTITLNVFNGDTIHGPTITTTTVMTGTVVTTTTVIAPPIGTSTASLAAISAIAPTTNVVDSAVIPMLSSNYEIPYMFSFATPIAAPDSGFFISLNLPTTVGDTAVLLCIRNDSSKTNYAWDYGINGWRAFSNSHDWTLYTSLTLFPVICYQPAGIEQLRTMNDELKIYPNPASTSLTITLSKGEGIKTTIYIYDMLGKIVMQHTYSPPSEGQGEAIDVSDLARGIYFVKITDNKNNQVTKKISIE
ncbi:MAG: T9SS type A sorting domain-containing protein [Bacteroidia bacterium]